MESGADNFKNLINKQLEGIFNTYYTLVKNTDEISEEELFAKIDINTIRYRFKQQKANSPKQIAYISAAFNIVDISKGSSVQKIISVSPATKKNPNINTLYTKDKQEAFQRTLHNFKQKVESLLNSNYPILGRIFRVKQQNNKEINEVSVYFEKPSEIHEKDTLVVNSIPTIVLKVYQINSHIAICKVKEDGEALKALMAKNKNPLVKKIDNSN